MLTEVKNNYKSILKHFDFDESISSADYRKQKLIEMAKSGEDRPTQKTKLGIAFNSYTNKSSKACCLKFHKIIKKLRPDWFIKSSDLTKQKLIKLAKSGEDKPTRRNTKEGKGLSSYTTKSSHVYCPEFDKTIRKLRPDWFESTCGVMKQNLIDMAKNKQARPSRKTKTKEGRALSSYTCKSSKSYCPIFDKMIRKLAPNWFRKCSPK